jgi:hypothetical protein
MLISRGPVDLPRESTGNRGPGESFVSGAPVGLALGQPAVRGRGGRGERVDHVELVGEARLVESLDQHRAVQLDHRGHGGGGRVDRGGLVVALVLNVQHWLDLPRGNSRTTAVPREGITG